MMLKDSNGHTVVLKSDSRRDSNGLYALDGTNLVKVDEAIVSEGDDVFLTREIVEDLFKKAGFPDLQFDILKNDWSPIKIKAFEGRYRSDPFNPLRFNDSYTLNGNPIDKSRFDLAANTLHDISNYNGLQRVRISTQKCKLSFTMDVALKMIGVGNIVTFESLKRGCAKNEERPRLMLGDAVDVTSRKKKISGFIRSIGNRVCVQIPEGKKISCEIENVKRITQDPVFEQKDNIDSSIENNFKFVLEESKKRIFRTKIVKGNFVYPAFPQKNAWGNMEAQRTQKNVPTCTCPICGWTMSYFLNSDDEFICCFCKQQGVVLATNESEVSLMLSRSPAKNRFAIQEARCCSNCGRFHFETGRQGKRCTGYCTAANQCVQAFNTCRMWYPRDIKRYEGNIRQHMTNLHYGVQDGRNTSRNDIRDTVYTEEDHKKEILRSEDAKIAYANNFNRLLLELRLESTKSPLVQEVTPEITEYWRKILDDPC